MNYIKLNKQVISFLLIAVFLSVNNIFVFANEFNVIKSDDMIADTINTAINRNLVPESLQSDLTQEITRAEFSALIVKLYETLQGEIAGRIEFTDTDDINIEKAAYIGVVTGVGDNRFNPYEILPREQAAVILSRLTLIFELDIDIPEWVLEVIYDIESISPWALESVLKMYRLGAIATLYTIDEGAHITEYLETDLGVGFQIGEGFQFVIAPQQPITREQSILAVNLLYEVLNTIIE